MRLPGQLAKLGRAARAAGRRDLAAAAAWGAAWRQLPARVAASSSYSQPRPGSSALKRTAGCRSRDAGSCGSCRTRAPASQRCKLSRWKGSKWPGG
eukprot:284939-Hanusia_phi.AAC.1